MQNKIFSFINRLIIVERKRYTDGTIETKITIHPAIYAAIIAGWICLGYWVYS